MKSVWLENKNRKEMRKRERNREMDTNMSEIK